MHQKINFHLQYVNRYIFPSIQDLTLQPYRSQILQVTSNSRTLSAIWLLFLNTTSSLQDFFANINIPFNCEFLVAQKKDGHVVILTEVYRVSSSLPLQTYRFARWTRSEGLNSASVGFYQRRNGLQGAVLKTAIKNVSVSCSL